MIEEAAVVIPYYRNELTVTERISLDRCRKVLGSYPIHFVKPQALNVAQENMCLTDQIVSVPDVWMNGIEAYNQMMLNIDFYRLFAEYKYILIYQLDAYVFSDRLMEFCAYEYDYIGAPWIEGKFDIEHEENGIVYVGNGGFSLRKVSSFLSILESYGNEPIVYNEDLFWGTRDSEIFKAAPVEIAMDFAFERPVRMLYEKNGSHLPFGCHAWMKYDFDFFKPYFISDGYNVLQDYEPAYEYDKHNKYIEQRFMLADELQILRVVHKLINLTPDTIYIYGAGPKGKICGYLLKKLQNKEIRYLDRDESKWGKKIYDFKIMSPEDIRIDEHTMVIITVNRHSEVLKKLAESNFVIGENAIIFDSFIETINLFMHEGNS
ncbi:MAG: hypothetical protein NC341_04035 [Blautia sp.]|nr:hypothetical protein [Blautia sp.]MCM1200767.1 hypothetical protein [Bacteroides fragilis]